MISLTTPGQHDRDVAELLDSSQEVLRLSAAALSRTAGLLARAAEMRAISTDEGGHHSRPWRDRIPGRM
jgi:hypothetical protein